MSVEFSIRDFFDPPSILRQRFFFEKSQRFTPDRMRRWQEERLCAVVKHAFERVPHYRDWARGAGVAASDVRTLEDFAKLPRLTAGRVRDGAGRLKADDAPRFRPQAGSTSGTSGQSLSFWLDRSTNALEFAYYWRYWNWAGYRLGNRFAEFSSLYFMRPGNEGLSFVRQRGTGRLLLNSLSLSKEACLAHARAIAGHRAEYLKGLPSVLYHFALFLRRAGSRPAFKAVFSTGEVLTPHARTVIESAFDCKVYDSYGQMQRLAAVSECPQGGMHVNSDYGLLELVDREPADPPVPGRFRARMLGTSFYNFSMPLLRYELGDIVEADENPGVCPCGRTLPLIRRIDGREEDMIETPDGRIVTTLFLAFTGVPGLLMGQIIQTDLGTLLVKLVKAPDFTPETEEKISNNIHLAVGAGMRIHFEYINNEELMIIPNKKFKIVSSLISHPQGCL